LARGFDAPEREFDEVRVAIIQRYRWPLSECCSDTQPGSGTRFERDADQLRLNRNNTIRVHKWHEEQRPSCHVNKLDLDDDRHDHRTTTVLGVYPTADRTTNHLGESVRIARAILGSIR